MAHDASQNNPVKEVVHALIGIVLLLTIIAGIAVFAWLRPAGNHEPATVSATPAGRALDELNQKQAGSAPTAEQEQATATAEAPSNAEATTTTEQPTDNTATATATEQPADNTATASASEQTEQTEQPAEKPAQ